MKVKAATNKGNNPSWGEAMHCLFADEYWKAAATEVESLEAMDTWKVLDQLEDMDVLQ